VGFGRVKGINDWESCSGESLFFVSFVRERELIRFRVCEGRIIGGLWRITQFGLYWEFLVGTNGSRKVSNL